MQTAIFTFVKVSTRRSSNSSQSAESSDLGGASECAPALEAALQSSGRFVEARIHPLGPSHGGLSGLQPPMILFRPRQSCAEKSGVLRMIFTTLDLEALGKQQLRVKDLR
jgi:hypothetical protein